MKRALIIAFAFVAPASAWAQEYEAAPVRAVGPFRFELAASRPIEGAGAAAGRLELNLPISSPIKLLVGAQAAPQGDPEACAAIGIAWRSVTLALEAPELERDRGQPSTLRSVLIWKGAF